MKQGIKAIQNLYEELERQREARQDLIADTRSLKVNSTNGVTMISVATGDDVLSYRLGEIAHRQLAERLAFPISIMSVCVRNILCCSMKMLMAG